MSGTFSNLLLNANDKRIKQTIKSTVSNVILTSEILKEFEEQCYPSTIFTQLSTTIIKFAISSDLIVSIDSLECKKLKISLEEKCQDISTRYFKYQNIKK